MVVCKCCGQEIRGCVRPSIMEREGALRNAGKPWTERLDAQLRESALRYKDRGFTADAAIVRLAARFRRTENAIRCRLDVLGLIVP